jgi:hypothetical protein
MPTILTVDKFKQITSASSNLDDSLIQPFINMVELTRLIPIIGEDMYNSILTAILDDNVESDIQVLLDNYIENMVAWYALNEAYPFLLSRIENKGVTMKYSENSQTIDASMLKLLKQSCIDKAVIYQTLLQDKLGLTTSTNKSNSTGFFLSF